MYPLRHLLRPQGLPSLIEKRKILLPVVVGAVAKQKQEGYDLYINVYVWFFLLTIQGQNQAAEGRHCRISQDLARSTTYSSWDVPWRKSRSEHMQKPSTQAAFGDKSQAHQLGGKSWLTEHEAQPSPPRCVAFSTLTECVQLIPASLLSSLLGSDLKLFVCVGNV